MDLAAVQEDMPYLHTALASANPELQQACLFPSYQQLAVFAEQHQHLDLSDALELFADRCAHMLAIWVLCPAMCRTHTPWTGHVSRPAVSAKLGPQHGKGHFP